MIKVSLCDKNIRGKFLIILSVISSLFSIFSLVVTIPNSIKCIIGFSMIGLLILIYIGLWLCANSIKKISVKIGNSRVFITEGDIFSQDIIKVIAFNEYFDTKVDNIIISDITLNGIFIKKQVSDVTALDKAIESDERLSKMKVSVNDDRLAGKKQRYKLGSIYKYSDTFFLTAFSKFDNDNRASLDMIDYVSFLLTFWNEIDKIYNGHSLAITIFGSGITRFNSGVALSCQDLLELIIWSFKMSRIKLAYPAELRIVLPQEKCNEINFYKLKEFE